MLAFPLDYRATWRADWMQGHFEHIECLRLPNQLLDVFQSMLLPCGLLRPRLPDVTGDNERDNLFCNEVGLSHKRLPVSRVVPEFFGLRGPATGDIDPPKDFDGQFGGPGIDPRALKCRANHTRKRAFRAVACEPGDIMWLLRQSHG